MRTTLKIVSLVQGQSKIVYGIRMVMTMTLMGQAFTQAMKCFISFIVGMLFILDMLKTVGQVRNNNNNSELDIIIIISNL